MLKDALETWICLWERNDIISIHMWRKITEYMGSKNGLHMNHINISSTEEVLDKMKHPEVKTALDDAMRRIKDDNPFYTDDLYGRYISYNYPQWHIKEYETVHDAFEEDVENCLEAGRNAHMAKTLDVKIITTIIAKYCVKKK